MLVWYGMGAVPRHAFSASAWHHKNSTTCRRRPFCPEALPQRRDRCSYSGNIQWQSKCLTVTIQRGRYRHRMKQPWKTKRNIQYQWEETRTVATLPYSGGPSGREEPFRICTKRLYDKVMKDGTSKLDSVDLVFFGRIMLKGLLYRKVWVWRWHD
jgi:hypothetical protein